MDSVFKNMLFVTILCFSSSLYSQIYKRELILKNNVLEIRQYDIDYATSEKNLSNIYYFNDSGLVAKELHLNTDKDSLAIFPDTLSTTIHEYDLLNRETKLELSTSSKKIIWETEYIKNNIRKCKSSEEQSEFIYSKKERKRNNLTIYKFYTNGHLTARVRKSKHADKTIARSTKSFKEWAKRGWGWHNPRKWKTIIRLDSLERNISDLTNYHRFFFLTQQSTSSTTYEGDLVKKVCYNTRQKLQGCYIYEYKTGIKLKEQ